MNLGPRDLVEAEARRCVYLAGFPRSGTSLLRQIMVDSFGLPTTAEYNESDLSSEFADSVGSLHIQYSSDVREWADQYGLVPVKTHRVPSGRLEPVASIVIVRDPRTLFPSLQRYYVNYGLQEFRATELIEGRFQWGSWSAWIARWIMHGRDCLWLRYEDILSDARTAIERIGHYIQREPNTRAIRPVGKLHANCPRMYGADRDELTQDEASLLWRTHGPVMTAMGYYPSGEEQHGKAK